MKSKAEKNQERIRKALLRAIKAHTRVVDNSVKQKLHLARALSLGLGLDTPVEVMPGQFFAIVRPKGHYTFYREYELKPVPKKKLKEQEAAE